MAAHEFTSVGPAPADREPTETPMFSNPVLTRRAPKSTGVNSWMMLVPLAILIILGAGYWAYSEMRPTPIMDNTSTASATPAAAPVIPAAPAPAAAVPVNEAAAQPATQTQPVAPPAPARRYAVSARAPMHRAPVHHRAAASSAASDAVDTSASAPAVSAPATPAPAAPAPAPSAPVTSTPTITPPSS